MVVVGIDLGTTRSSISRIIDSDPEIIKVQGKTVTRSVVHIAEDNRALVGEAADEKLLLYPEQTIEQIKSEMGTDAMIKVGDNEYIPEQISALIVQYLVDNANERLDEEITDAIITVPAYFGDQERVATATAGRLAEVDVPQLLPEPSAACLSYGHKKKKLGSDESEIVFVFDLGGGTFDATVVEVDYELNVVETLHTDGDTNLGGSLWTDRIVDWAAEMIKQDTGVDIRTDPEQSSRVREEARRSKHQLSYDTSVEVSVQYIIPEQHYTFNETLTRAKFKELTADLIEQTRTPTDAIFDRSGLTVDDIDTVLLVGGATRMPQVSELITDYFSVEPSQAIDPQEAVSEGAAIRASLIEQSDDKELTTDEEFLLIDVVPRSLGIRLDTGEIDRIIETDKQLPVTEKRTYSTSSADQDQVHIHVYEGEGETVDAKTVRLLGKAALKDIPPRDPSEESIECMFELTQDGTLNVTGTDLESGKEVSTTIDSAVRRAPQAIETLNDQLPSRSWMD